MKFYVVDVMVMKGCWIHFVVWCNKTLEREVFKGSYLAVIGLKQTQKSVREPQRKFLVYITDSWDYF